MNYVNRAVAVDAVCVSVVGHSVVVLRGARAQLRAQKINVWWRDGVAGVTYRE
jgi:hypothetical protein